jgi:HSP20 family molecular chaperone IbpA
MSETNPQPWKWENFEKLFKQKLPLLEKGQSLLDNMDWVENYVQDVLKKAMPKLNGGLISGTLESSQFDVFETHDHVIVQVKLHKEENPRALQVFVKSNQVKLTGFLKGGTKIIKLPTLVSPRTARARYKLSTLQIQIRKRGRKESYHEAYIRF